VFPRAPERERVTAEPQVEDFVKFWGAGARANGSFRCVDCGFYLATVHRLPLCANCRGELWERAETSPFGPGPPVLTPGADLHAAAGAVRAALLGVALGSVLWLGLAGLAFGLFRLFHG
jgi:hypothetical protein